jgi:hypothetical protein
VKEVVVKKGRIRAHINVPGVSLDLDVADSPAHLREIRRILASLPAKDLLLECDVPYYWAMSEELRASQHILDFIRQAAKAEAGAVYRKLSFDTVRVVDANRQECFSTLDATRAREQLHTHLTDFDSSVAKFGLVHVMGTVSKDDKALLVDAIRKQFPRAELKTHYTHKEVMGKAVVEVLLFGDFQREEF